MSSPHLAIRPLWVNSDWSVMSSIGGQQSRILDLLYLDLHDSLYAASQS